MHVRLDRPLSHFLGNLIHWPSTLPLPKFLASRTLSDPMLRLGGPNGERVRNTRKVRILLAEMPRMLMDIIKGIIATQRDFAVVGEVSVRNRVPRALADTRADVMIVGPQATTETEDYSTLLYQSPRMKIIAITAGGQEAVLHVLRPHVIQVADVSPASLIAAIRGTPPSDWGVIAP